MAKWAVLHMAGQGTLPRGQKQTLKKGAGLGHSAKVPPSLRGLSGGIGGQ